MTSRPHVRAHARVGVALGYVDLHSRWRGHLLFDATHLAMRGHQGAALITVSGSNIETKSPLTVRRRAGRYRTYPDVRQAFVNRVDGADATASRRITPPGDRPLPDAPG